MPIQVSNAWKPHQGTPLAASGLAAGLVGLWPLNEGGGPPTDLVTGTVATANVATWGGSPYGSALTFNGTNQYVIVGSNSAWSLTGPLTVAALCNPPAGTGANQNIVDFRQTANTGGFTLASQSAGPFILTTASGGVTTSAASSAAAIDGGWHLLVASMASTATNGVSFYRDGKLWGVATNTRAPAAYGGGVLGANAAHSAAFETGSLALVGIWARVLSAVEHAELARNPWQLLAPRRYYSLLRAAAAPGGAAPRLYYLARRRRAS